MKGDFSRQTFDPKKHFTGVLMQQGRVQLDADWNEQIGIATHRTETETIDVIGACGAPIHDAGFALIGGAIPRITQGRYYVDGLLCENENEINLDEQVDLPGLVLPTPPPAVGDPSLYIAYLDGWQRHVTALEDHGLREVALGGPDTATRSKTIWQVKLLGPFADPLTCSDEPPEWQQLVAKKSARLRARAQPAPVNQEACIVPPGAGYRRLENQLYRVEVHQGSLDANGNPVTPTFKWSRDNGSIVTSWLDKKDNDLTVGSIGRDEVLRFAANQWVELTDDTHELNGLPGTLVQLKNAEGQVLTIDPATASGPVERSAFANNAKIRRWDHHDEETPSIILVNGAVPLSEGIGNDGWIALEEGVEVQFVTGGVYQSGDYWLIPARTVTADVEWPRDDANPPNPLPQPPAGIDHHYCKLAILRRDAGGFTLVEDCRQLFPPLTELSNLLYVGGDGQEAMPGLALTQPLQVRVANGQIPVLGARVQFSVLDGGGGLSVAVPVLTTAPDGIAQCEWTLGVLGAQLVEAVLLDSASQPVPGQVVHFGATLSVASQVAYDPANCLDLASAKTVQDAIDALCKRPTGGGCCISVGEGGQYERLDGALADLLGEGERDICLCLLHGDHRLTIPEIVQSLGERDLHIKITGAGLGSRIHLEGPIIFSGVKAVTLHDVAIEVEFEAEGERGAMAFDGCGQISLTGCTIVGSTRFGADIAGGTLVSVAATASARLRDMRMEARTRITFELLLRSLIEVGAGVLADAMNSAETGGLAFLEAALAAGAAIANMDDIGRRELAAQLGQLAQMQVLDEGELFNLTKMRLALRDPERKAEDYAAIIIDMRRAAIKARPGVALVLSPLPEADAIARLPMGSLDRDTFISIESSEIAGEIGLYGLPVTPGVFAQQLPEDLLRRLQGLMRQGQFLLADGSLPLGTLEMRGNQIVRIGLAMRIVNAFANQLQIEGMIIGFFNELLLTDNVFEGFPVVLAAIHCGLASNQFVLGRDLMVGVVFGQSGAYTGNRSEDSRLFDITQFRGDAANVRISIL